MMCLLFDVKVPTINEHINNIFKESELSEDSVIRKFRITAEDVKNIILNLILIHYYFIITLIEDVVMKHKIGQNLLEWKNSETRKPFILQGARQVGKTYIVNFFARKEYSNYIYCNFGFENGIKSVPLYAIFCIGECIINKLFF